MMNTKRFILSLVMAWLLFVMIDFSAHATLLRHFWDKEFSVFKSKQELFCLIPFGYLSFLILTFLVGWVYTHFYRESGDVKKGISFGAIFGALFALATFFAWYSALNLPFLFILLVSFIYFVEIAVVGFTFSYLMHLASVKKRLWVLIVVVGGFVVSIILQNILPSSQ